MIDNLFYDHLLGKVFGFFHPFLRIMIKLEPEKCIQTMTVDTYKVISMWPEKAICC